MRIRVLLATAVSAFAALAPAAWAAQTFNPPVELSNPPIGGEPSIATDPMGDVLVAGPQSIPSAVNGTTGTGLWRSTDGGNTFGKGVYIGSNAGGGDNDVIYDQGTFYTADLEAAGTEICQSTDRGQTWSGVGPIPDPSNCTTVNAGQAGPSDDRPWLAADPTNKQRVYLVYHEFVSAQPLAFRTDNGGGDDFANPCGSIVSAPAIEANVPTDVTGGTLVARPVLDKRGNLYVLFATTTQQQNAAAASTGQTTGTFSQLYLAVSKDHCQTFTDYTVFDGSKVGTNTVQFGDIFNDLAIDGAGNLYVLGAGYIGTTPFAPTTNLYLLSSSDHGQHWSHPVQLDSPASAHMLPAAVGGPGAGQLAVGYFRTVNGVTDPNSSQGKWTYSTADSTNANSSAPTFSYADVNPGFVYHNGEVCNQGTLCGTVPGQPSDRSLLDFTSVALGAGGCPLYTFAGNPTGSAGKNDSSNTSNYVARQVTGCFSSSGASGTTGQHHHKHKKHHHHHKHRKHRKHKKHRHGHAHSAVSFGFTG